MSNVPLGRAVLVLSTDDGEFRVGLDKARVEVGRFGKATDDAGGIVSKIGPLVKGAFAATAIVAAGKAAIDYAGNISDIAGKLRISTDTAQEWEATFGAAGVELSQVAKAATELSTRLVGGDKSAVAALKKLGFTVDELKAMRPEERFNKVADAIAKIQDSGEQLYASKAIMGKGGPELLAALDGNLEATIQRMRDMGVVIDSETIAAADEFGDQIGVMGKQLMALLATVLTPLLPVLSAVGQALMWIGQNVIGPVLNVAVKGAITLLGIFWERTAEVLGKLSDLASRLPGVGGKFAELSTWLKDSAAKSGEYVQQLWTQTEKAGTVADVAAPKLMGFGNAAEVAGSKAQKKADQVRELTKHLTEVSELGLKPATLGSRGFREELERENPVIVELDKRLRAMTKQGLEPLEKTLPGVTIQLYDWAAAHDRATEAMDRQLSSLYKMPGAVTTAAEAYRSGADGVGASTDSLGGKITGFFQNIPKAIGGIQESLTNKLTSLFGASQNSVLGSVIGMGMNFVFGPLSGLAVQLMQKGLTALGNLAMKGLKKIGGFFKNMFGGPDAAEVAGRQVVDVFEKSLSAGLTAAQRLEAGNDEWKQTVIALRDKYLDLGLTEEQALEDARRLWESSKGGAEEAARVIDEIRQRIERGITVPVSVTIGGDSLPIVPMATGGMGRVTRPTLFLAGEAGPEDYAFGGRRGLFNTQGGGGGTAILEVAGRVLAEVMVPEIPGVVQRYGLVR